MQTPLPPLRALQAFEAFGRILSVAGAARELGVTSGAVSQQLKLLEETVGLQLIAKQGRRVTLTVEAESYHRIISRAFTQLRHAQDHLADQKSQTDLSISALPTLLTKWLNPRIHRFQAGRNQVSLRMEATHQEPGPDRIAQMFRLTYGSIADSYPHSRKLFRDVCFPVCSPDFLAIHPQARDPRCLAALPLIEIDWGAAHLTAPRWPDWFRFAGVDNAEISRPVAEHSLSSLAIEAAAAGHGVALAQASFADIDLQLGRLVRLSDAVLPMPASYYVCWDAQTLDRKSGREFLNWLIAEARDMHARMEAEY